ncbi:hypothetical protein UA70_15730 [Raoultella planticola]|nr:hypothetical protein UA70_15730 [Raoultella planticola]
MVKALTTLLNNGKVKNPHLLYSMKRGNKVERYQPPDNTPQVGDPKSPYWGIVRNGMYGMANLPNGTGYKLFHTAPYQIAAKSGTSQVFSLKENQTYNAKMIPVRLRDHIFYTLFAPYQHPKVAMALILETAAARVLSPGQRRALSLTTSLIRPTRLMSHRGLKPAFRR